MNKIIASVAGVAIIAGASTGFISHADASASQEAMAARQGLVLPSTPVWGGSGASSTFDGFSHCVHDDYNAPEDHQALCFIITAQDDVVLLYPDTATTQGKAVYTQVKA